MYRLRGHISTNSQTAPFSLDVYTWALPVTASAAPVFPGLQLLGGRCGQLVQLAAGHYRIECWSSLTWLSRALRNEAMAVRRHRSCSSRLSKVRVP